MDYQLKETIIIDDLIPVSQQDEFHNAVINQPWRFVKDMSYANYDLPYPSYGFNCMFKHPEYGVVSPMYESVCVPLINTLLDKTDITISDIYFNRAFLQIPLANPFVKEHNGIHIDIPIDHYACVYYMNDSDGDTIIYEQNRYDTPGQSQNVKMIEHKRVTPKKGRFVLFDGARYHCSSQPREKYRCIINFDLI